VLRLRKWNLRKDLRGGIIVTLEELWLAVSDGDENKARQFFIWRKRLH